MSNGGAQAVTSGSYRIPSAVPVGIRVLAGVIGVVGVVYGGLLSWPPGVFDVGAADGLAIASVFAVGVISLVFAFTGVTPTSVKFKDVEVTLEAAKQDGKESGGLRGLQVGAAIGQALDKGTLAPNEVEAALRKALSTDESLHLGNGTKLMVPKLPEDEAAREAEQLAKTLTGGPPQ